ncbi:MAG: ISAs1 family transposase [archaeon]|nr:ISAs1 family transposase [archaeon]
MIARSYTRFIELFKEIEDPRQDEKVTYPLHEVLFVVMVGVLGCQETWPDILDFCEHRMHILGKYFPYENGLPSISTLMRVFGLIDSSCIERWLSSQANNFVQFLSGEQIIFDGKSLRGKRKFNNDNQNTHILNVFASNFGIVLTQKAIPEKSSEIKAIHDILEDANLKGATVSIDAIGCQKDIAEKIVSKGGEYFLALKANQGTLLSDVESMFSATKSYFPDIYEETDAGHGRIEHRICESINDVNWLKTNQPKWKNLTSVIKLTRKRIINNEETISVNYYISSQKGNAKLDLQKSRNHWKIENNLHWVLDVQFGEDNSLMRKNNAAENMSAIRKMVINIIKSYKTKINSNSSINSLRKHFMWSEDKMMDTINSWIRNCS